MDEKGIEGLIRNNVQDLTPYQVLDFPCKIRMDANESPYDLSSEIRQLLYQEIAQMSFNRYPDSDGKRLKQGISSLLGIDKEMLILGNGSDELILYLLMTIRCNSVLYPVPTFLMYGILGQIVGVTPKEVLLTKGFELNEDGVLQLANQEVLPPIIFLSYPNNPTGNCFSEEKIIKIIENTSGLVVVDEAYYEFSKKTFLPLLSKYKNLAILRTFSKIGLAGLRVGYLIGHPELIYQLSKVRLPYNLNSFSQVAANILVQNIKPFEDQIEQILQERRNLYLQLKCIDAITVYPSDANFILFKTKNKEIFDYLVENDILIRKFSNNGLLKDCFRVTIGTRDENEIFISMIKEELENLEG